MYKNKAEQEAAEKRMAKNANIWGAISVAFIGLCGLTGYFVFGMNSFI